MTYKVLPLDIKVSVPKITGTISAAERRKMAVSAAKELEGVLNKQAETDWTFQRTEQLETNFGTYYVAIFTK
jgi:hypothetical protein